MNAKLRFLGAAGNVTGSSYLLEANHARILVDCGLYQEREFQGRNWEPFPISPAKIDAVLLTHAHLDHCGLLPKLVREGFRGRIYCTAATAEIARIILLDSASIQEEDAHFKRKRHEREGRKGPYPEEPLYTKEDAHACFPLFTPVRYDQEIKLGRNVWATFSNAGHVLGSAIIRIRLADGDEQQRTVVFSGDIGRWDKAILPDPTQFEEADYVLVESTYGDRLHGATEDIETELADVINSTVEAGGNIVIPSFALERAQEVLYYLDDLLRKDRIPHVLAFLDSPMAVKVTEIFEHHPELLKPELIEMIRHGDSPFDFPGLTLTPASGQSKALNRLRGSAVIIAGAGMCTGGRIKQHLVRNISRPESTILFVGYQAAGTLGRRIVDGADEVRILGETYEVKAKVTQIHGFSAHADRDELLRWLTVMSKPPKQVFVVHGEADASAEFSSYVAKKTGWNTYVPSYLEEIDLA